MMGTDPFFGSTIPILHSLPDHMPIPIPILSFLPDPDPDWITDPAHHCSYYLMFLIRYDTIQIKCRVE